MREYEEDIRTMTDIATSPEEGDIIVNTQYIIFKIDLHKPANLSYTEASRENYPDKKFFKTSGQVVIYRNNQWVLFSREDRQANLTNTKKVKIYTHAYITLVDDPDNKQLLYLPILNTHRL